VHTTDRTTAFGRPWGPCCCGARRSRHNINPIAGRSRE
jgi:hypothetical protein